MRLTYERLPRQQRLDSSGYSDESPLLSTSNATSSKSMLLRRINLRKRSKVVPNCDDDRKLGGIIRAKYPTRLGDIDSGYEAEDEMVYEFKYV